MECEDISRGAVERLADLHDRVAGFGGTTCVADTLRALRDALDRAEAEWRVLDRRIRKQREELARLQTAQEVAQRFCQERNEWRKRAKQAEAERDAAYAAGQRDMRERGAAAVEMACVLLTATGFTTFSDRVKELAPVIRALPIRDWAEDRQLNAIADARADGPFVPVPLDDLDRAE